MVQSARRRVDEPARKRNAKPKPGHGPVSEVDLSLLRPSPENDRLYRPVDPNDPSIKAMAKTMAQHGVREPLVVTLDGYVLSGHRRYAAAKVAGLRTVPVRIEQIRRFDDVNAFVTLLAVYNQQREKSLDEKLRENIATADPTEAYKSLIEHREERSAIGVDTMPIVGTTTRCAISPAKLPFLQAVCKILNSAKQYWPLSDRRIHYKLLDDPPLKHASKQGSVYDNTKASYKSLVDLLTRARLAGNIPMSAIADDTRPVVIWDVHREPGTFIHKEIDRFLKGYHRDLQQSQPCHIEIVGEKNTVAPTLRPVAAEYCIPMTTGRGYCSLPPRYAIAQRFKRSGKEKLILLIASDFDPDGIGIAHSFARSMRDDFGIQNVEAIRVALTAEQVRERNLPPVMIAKETSVHYEKFTAEHGENVFELDALELDDLQDILKDAIDSVLDIDAFNAELDAYKKDAAFLEGVRKTIHEALAGLNLGTDE